MANIPSAGGVKTNAPHVSEIQNILDALSSVTNFDNVRFVSGSVYKAKIEQNGSTSSAPTASVIYNTTGATLTWEYSAVGVFTVSSSVSTTFKSGYTFVNAALGVPLSASIEASLHAFPSASAVGSTDLIEVQCFDSASVLTNGFFEGFFEISIH